MSDQKQDPAKRRQKKSTSATKQKASGAAKKRRTRSNSRSRNVKDSSTQSPDKSEAKKARRKPKKSQTEATPAPNPETNSGNKPSLPLILSSIAICLALIAVGISLNQSSVPPQQVKNDATPKQNEQADKADSTETPKEPRKFTEKQRTDESPKNSTNSNTAADLVHFTPKGKLSQGKVKTVVDGDTLYLKDGRKIRLIGINTPERDEPFYKEASALTRRLCSNKTVKLLYDKDRKDKFKRHLCYVFVDDHFINGEVVKQGLAYFYEFKPNTRFSDLIRKIQRQSRQQKLGLWSQNLKQESHYVSFKRAHRFHRPKCKRMRGRPDVKFSDRNEALDTGRSPCGDCRP